MVVNIEETSTWDKTKLYSEDTGLCLLDVDGERILIEGLFCRYVAHGKDVVECEPMGKSAAMGKVVMGFRVGGSVLRMVFTKLGEQKGNLKALQQLSTSPSLDLVRLLNSTWKRGREDASESR